MIPIYRRNTMRSGHLFDKRCAEFNIPIITLKSVKLGELQGNSIGEIHINEVDIF